MRTRLIASMIAILGLALAADASGVIATYSIPISDIERIAGLAETRLEVAVPLMLTSNDELYWAYLYLEVRPERLPDAEDQKEILCLVIQLAGDEGGSVSDAAGEYLALPGQDKTVMFDVTAVARRWLANPALSRRLVVGGCDVVEDACTLRAVEHDGLGGRIVVGYRRK